MLRCLSKLAVATGLLFAAVQLSAAVITFSPGIAFEHNGRTQTLLLETSPMALSNRYVDSNDWHNTLVTQLFVGKDFYQQKNLKLRSGLTVGYVDDIQVNGLVQQLALPQFTNLSYRYSVQSFSAMATLEMLFLPNKKWQPYVEGGIGFSNNNTYGYQETPLITGAVAMYPYGGRAMNSFAYQFGVGLMYQFNSLFSVGLGYQFADLGQAELGVSPAQQTNWTPSVGHVFLQQLMFHFSWTI